MSGKNKKGESNSKDSAIFKPFLGIRPGVYLFALYVLILTLIVFFILVFPGLVQRQAKVSFTSEPWGSAVRMDGVYIGSTPFTFKVPQGTHTFTFVLPGFGEKNTEKQIRGKIFASLFFPKKEHIHETLRTGNPVQTFALGAQSFAEWTFAGESTAIYQHPMDLSEAAYRIGFVGDSAARNGINDIIKASARFAITKSSVRDLVRAKFLADNGGKAVSPLSLITSMQEITQYLASSPGSSRWLGAVLPGDALPKLVESAWYGADAQLTAAPLFGPFEDTTLRIGGLVFRKLPGGKAFIDNSLFTGNFWISETEVSQAAWDAFVRENPEWAPENINTLISRGLVNSVDLQYPNNPSYPHPAVPGVSWFAAKVYCEWLGGLLPASMKDYTIRLPREAEWEYAALYDGEVLQKRGLGLVNITGGLWEWCEEPYAPLNYLPASREAINMVSSPQRPVRGTSWAGTRSSGALKARGALEPFSCSPFVSFRPVIVFNPGIPNG